MEGIYESHINSFQQAEFYEHMGLDCLQEEEEEDEEEQLTSAAENTTYEPSSVMNSHAQCGYKHQMPFLQMLQERASLLVELEAQQEQSQPNSFQMLLRVQEEQLFHRQTSSLEKESCVTDAALAVEKEKEEEEKMGRKKRKRCRSSSSTKKAEEAESKRMSHIAVERNRRRLMNEHIAALRSLMPPSYIQRGDQASVVGGAIDLVKELEQHLQSLQAEKQSRTIRSRSNDKHLNHQCPFDGFFTSPQYTMQKPSSSSISSSLTSELVDDEPDGGYGSTTSVANIEVMLIQTHVNLRILTPKRPGQLVRAIAAIEDLHLTVLHLTVVSVDDSVLYSLNLKTEEECKLGSADEIATAVHQIFSCIDSITKCLQRWR